MALTTLSEVLLLIQKIALQATSIAIYLPITWGAFTGREALILAAASWIPLQIIVLGGVALVNTALRVFIWQRNKHNPSWLQAIRRS